MKPTHNNSGKMRACFYCLEPDPLIADCEACKWRTTFAQSRCVGVASVHPVVDSSSFSTRSSVYRPFMLLSGSVALTKKSNLGRSLYRETQEQASLS